MSNRERIGTCCLCGEQKPLTREHVPPQKAFNGSEVLMHKIDLQGQSGELQTAPAGRPYQGGYWSYTLCEKCNNDTGGDYGRAYVEFAQNCAPCATTAYANQSVAVPGELFPMRVAKQALAIMCSSCGTDLTENHPDLRRLLLNKTERGLLHPLGLYAYLKCDECARITGRVVSMKADTGVIRAIAEFAWWPLGLILSFDEVPVEKATSITHWLNFGFSQKLLGPVELPCLWAHTLYPLDHRNRSQVEREAAENRARAREKGYLK